MRNWQEADVPPLAEMSLDPEVMFYFPDVQSEEATKDLVQRLKEHFDDFGYTYFAMDELETGTFVGFNGLKYQTFESGFTPSVDIGWRLTRSAWGKGYATEAAKACLDAAFDQFGLREIYSYCPDLNKPSEAIMKKIGMEFVGTFMHPKVAGDSRFKHCVVYQKTKV